MKMKSIKKGNTEFTLTLVNKDSFPVVEGDKLPYVSMTGNMKEVTANEMPDLHKIHVLLLEKYMNPKQGKWLSDLIEKLKTKPNDTWMLQFTPGNLRHY